jgi:Transglutaminase-like superfamily
MLRPGFERSRFAPVSGARSLGPLARARLATEIVGAYLKARRHLRQAPIESVIAELRAASASAASLAAQPQTQPDLEQARRLGRAVAATLRLLPGDTRCLVRSLVLTRLLARREIPARLVIGARSEPEFLAHAWVECAGAPVLSPGDGSFARLVEL